MNAPANENLNPEHAEQVNAEAALLWDMASKHHMGLLGFSAKDNCFIIMRRQPNGLISGFALPEELNDMLKAFFLK